VGQRKHFCLSKRRALNKTPAHRKPLRAGVVCAKREKVLLLLFFQEKKRVLAAGVLR
jgi:hypothetical protein